MLGSNVRHLLNGIPQDLSNSVLLFLVGRAIDRVHDVLVLEVVQTWRLLQREARSLKDCRLSSQDSDFRDLKRIRDTLVAHRIENTIKTTEDLHWYRIEYGSYEKTFALIERVAEKLRNEIERLLKKGKLQAVVRPLGGVRGFDRTDVDQLVEALKARGIF